uniref:Uncharacterized protein n=1 Tax=uncultured organism TaxID=155900 RepID=M1PWJ5_9ZZZZ|nr:hypothetical protein FLSS-29_0001 [uncultured organism]
MRIYTTHKEYGEAAMQEIITQFEGEVSVKELNNLRSIVYLNESGEGFFEKPLPSYAQFSPLFDIFLDVQDTQPVDYLFKAGNLRGGDVYSSSYDAMKSFISEVKAEGNVVSVNKSSTAETGIHLNGYTRAIYKINNSSGADRFAIVYDTGEVRLFERAK